MPRRATAEEIVEHFDSLPRGAGSAEERLRATARYFQVKPEAVHRHLKFWWPGKKYMEEFGEERRSRVKWDRSTEELLQAMEEHRCVAQAAKALGTTAVTLNNALERHGIRQRWVVDSEGAPSGRRTAPRGRPRGKAAWRGA